MCLVNDRNRERSGQIGALQVDPYTYTPARTPPKQTLTPLSAARTPVCREISRVRAECFSSGKCQDDDPILYDFSRFMLKVTGRTALP